ncbi:MAG: DNA-binding response regulator [Acidobacteria bacterium]|nr:DNA-binding response regulator [Acidobacteriota bacterium]HJN46386.1 sigma-54 dependent transcriptional regulator [Vicinamibacterales bacterium]
MTDMLDRTATAASPLGEPLSQSSGASRATVLVVDDDHLVRWSLVERLTRDGYRTLEAGTGREALKLFTDGVDLVLLDYSLPDTSGLAVLREMGRHGPDTLVILLTACSSVDSAVEVTTGGAYHCITKPFNLEELMLLVGKAVEMTRLRRDVRALRANQAQPCGLDRIVGCSPTMQAVRDLLAKIAASRASTVLLIGERGTGKELAAKVIHDTSDRTTRPFLSVSCSALTDTLLESELFGDERGTFTGARRPRRGLFESANGGSVFLDDVGEMAPWLQAKLLRVLEERTFRRPGGLEDVHVDVRVIAATNKNLEEAVDNGTFRADLFYRLNPLSVRLPPLRDRTDDIAVLTTHYIDHFNRECRKHVRGANPEVFAALERYSWPGNVRELRNTVERAMLGDVDVLTLDDFPTLSPRVRLAASGLDLKQLERDLVIQALERACGNQGRAAMLLGLNRDQIRYRIQKFGLNIPHTAQP